MTHPRGKLKPFALTLLILVFGLLGHAQAVDYWSGGVGAESRADAPSGHNTHFEFFERNGSYLTGLEVRISEVDGGNVLLDTDHVGPWLRVDLPDGYYRIEATRPSNGEVQRVRFEVTNSRTEGLMGLRYME
ncbi:MAG: hypothetical protein LAT62_03505 [Natronospirillum sp.]|uniref:hypothetical protein n=1 Tax=Natronospirillum sp. TaxID=2812955 RepID=UPI0025F69E00|nr:hypothetical protein [Natronospirillum sp.]MCH8550977.1 hypothetical protein [Natronospirillum sp.]